MSFLLYISSFFLTYVGFLLGSSTNEEHNEIKKTTLKINSIIKIIYFVLASIVFYTNIIVEIVMLIVFILFLINTYKVKNLELKKWLDIFILGISMLVFIEYAIEYIGIVLILIFTMIVEKSFEKFHLKESIYSVVIYLVFYISYFIVQTYLG